MDLAPGWSKVTPSKIEKSVVAEIVDQHLAGQFIVTCIALGVVSSPSVALEAGRCPRRRPGSRRPETAKDVLGAGATEDACLRRGRQ